MEKIFNINNVSDDFIDDPTFQSGLMTKLLGNLGGNKQIYVNIDYVKPGKFSVKFHSHSIQEEFFLVLGGTGILRLNQESLPVKKGDFFSKPAGKNINHQFINNGDEVLEILDCGTKSGNDIVTYPDEGVVFIKDTGSVFKNADKIENWTSEPNK